MITKELVDFIKKSASEGQNKEKIKAVLLENSWLSTDVEEGFLSAFPVAVPASPLPYSSALPYTASRLNIVQEDGIPNVAGRTLGTVVTQPKSYAILKVSTPMATPVVTTMPKRNYEHMFVSILIILLIGATGAAGFYYRTKILELFTTPVVLVVPVTIPQVEEKLLTPIVSEPTSPVTHESVVAGATPIKCENDIPCFITAALKCQPALGSLIFINVPSSVVQGFDKSSQATYEMKKSLDQTKCFFSYVTTATSFSVTETNRQKMLKGGVSNVKIDTELAKLNKSAMESNNLTTICTGDTVSLVSYFTDLKNNLSNSFKTTFQSTGGVSGFTLTTSAGKKLACTFSS